MADKPARCPNCGHERYTDSPYCPFCGARATAPSSSGSVWSIIKAILIAIVAIPFAALGGCAACFLVGMGSAAMPEFVGAIGFQAAIFVGLAVFVVCLIAIFRQVRF